MEKRRIGEDFKYVWSINWNGVPEDFSDTLEMVLTASVYGKRKELERDVDYVVDGNLLKIDFTPKICTISGIYNLELNYVKPSDGFIDGERRSAVDIDAFQIVPKSAQITATGGITGTSDAVIGFYGLSAYEVWLKDNPESTKEDYYNWLRQPATDAVSLIDDKIEHLDEIIDSSTENEAERVTAESLRVEAELLRQSSTQEAISDAEEATLNANTAAQNADDARLAIQSDLAGKEATANKQNSLTPDGTGTKFPTVDAVTGNIPTKAEAEGNIENTKFMTALRVFQNFVKNATTYVFSTLNTTSKTITGAINELFANKANKTQEAWITPTLINGATGSVQYMIDNFGIVRFKGSVKNVLSGTIVFHLPAGYRPSYFTVLQGNRNLSATIVIIYLDTGGNVSVISAGMVLEHSNHFDGVNFLK